MREPPAGGAGRDRRTQDAAHRRAGAARSEGGCGVPGRRLAAYLHRRSAGLGRRRSDPHRRALRGRRYRSPRSFAGLKDTAAPDDVWHIDAVYLDPRWVQNQDPLADFAIARVSRDAGGSVEAQAGGGLTLGPAPKPGTVVTVTGYGMGVGGGPIGCRTATAVPAKGFPALDCAELVDGLSGAPWIDGSKVTGVIGGLNGGGCEDESISYSPPFDDAVKGLLARAEAGGPPDDRADGVRRRLRLGRGTGSARAACSSRPAQRPCRPRRTSGS